MGIPSTAQAVYTYTDLLNNGAPLQALNEVLEPLSAHIYELRRK